MFVSAAFMLLFLMRFDTVETIKPFPDEDVGCASLAFHGDVVFIGDFGCVIQWNVVTGTVMWLDEYPDGLIVLYFYHTCLNCFKLMFMVVLIPPLTAVL